MPYHAIFSSFQKVVLTESFNHIVADAGHQQQHESDYYADAAHQQHASDYYADSAHQ